MWTAFKVGALSYGGGFVIIPLMQADAVSNGWMTDAEFAGAVAFGQITPGPVVQTVAVVGLRGGRASGARCSRRSSRSRRRFSSSSSEASGSSACARTRNARAFLDGAGPAAVGAIFGAAVPLLEGVAEPWQLGVLAAAAIALFAGRIGTVPVLLAACVAGALAALAGGAVPA